MYLENDKGYDREEQEKALEAVGAAIPARGSRLVKHQVNTHAGNHEQAQVRHKDGDKGKEPGRDGVGKGGGVWNIVG